jgi:AraC family transcriptional regulator
VSAWEEIGRVLDAPPVLAEPVLKGDTRLTRRWYHGRVHGDIPPLTSHVVMTYYGNEQDIAYRSGLTCLTSRTREGSISLIPIGHSGSWDVAGPIEVSHLYLSEARFQACVEYFGAGQRVELVDRVGFADPSAALVMELLAREADVNVPSSRLFLEQAIDLLCTQLVRGHSTVGLLPDSPPRRGLAAWQVKKVTSYILDHLAEEIGLEELAAIVNLSRFHFCTAFRLATGRSPYGWLVRERINRATNLLHDHALNITEVGLAVGYGTPSAFAASFRKCMGVSPSEYRWHL